MNSPCYQCIARYPACHSACEEYALWQAELERQKQLRQKEHDIIDYERRTAARMMKIAHHRGGGKANDY